MNYIKKHTEIDELNSNHFVHLRDAKAGSPVFCIHPSGGDVGIYRKLGRSLRTQTTIGIQSRMNFGLANEYETVTQIARVYATLIDRYQPTGPIQLLGFSFGGFIANAMVEQFARLGREVGFFGVIDSDLRWASDKVAVGINLSARMEQISMNLRTAGLLNELPREQVKLDIKAIVDMCVDGVGADVIAQELEARGHTTRSHSDSSKFKNFVVRFAAHCRMIQEFKPSVMEVPVHCWWPSEGEEEHQLRCQPWRDLALSGMFESTIEGSHYSIMKIPCVKTIAAEISSALTKSTNHPVPAVNQP